MHNDPITLSRAGVYDPVENFPERWRDYLAGGERPATFTRDLGTAIDQVPRWAWATVAVATAGMAYFAYRGDKKRKAGAR